MLFHKFSSIYLSTFLSPPVVYVSIIIYVFMYLSISYLLMYPHEIMIMNMTFDLKVSSSPLPFLSTPPSLSPPFPLLRQ